MATRQGPKTLGAVDVFPLPSGIRVERDVPVVMRDGVKLSLNVFRPEKRGAFPVIMALTIYGKDADPKDYAPEYTALRESIGLGLGSFRISECTPFEAPDPAYWVPHGYAVVHVDVRGFFKSEGTPTPFGEIMEEDSVELIEWAGTREWSNGNVGLHGVSYLAICQWYVAARNPRHLKAIVPWEGVSDTYRDVLYHGGVPETGFFPWWASGHQGTPGTDDEHRRSLLDPRPVQDGPDPRQRRAADQRRLLERDVGRQR